jgi:hypothetical protein
MAGGGPASSTQQPALTMEDDNDGYLESLSEGPAQTLRKESSHYPSMVMSS